MIGSYNEEGKKYTDKPLVSIIMAVFNGVNYLEETIISVINQSYSRIEFIVIDGKSTDGTVEIIKKYNHKISYWISESDKGIYEAWNKGIKKASGEWLSFVACGDILLPNAIEQMVNFVNQNEDKEFEYISSRIEFVTNDLKHKRFYGEPWDWNTFKCYMNVAHPASIHNKVLFYKYGVYDTSYKIAADYEFLLRAKSSLSAGFMNIVILKMRNDDGLSIRSIRTQYETRDAKIKTSQRNPLLANYEMIISIIKMQTRRFLNK